MDQQAIQDKQEQQEQQEQKEKKSGRSFLEWVWALGIALLIALVLTQFVMINAQVPTGSMENTIQVGDRVFGLRLAYLFDGPQRGDIVVFRWPDDETQLFVKRVIGLPGETVEIIDGKVYINGSAEPLDEPYLKDVPEGSAGPYVVPAGHYFVMGDNRNHSLDSRVWDNTFVSDDEIVGKALFRIYPDPTVLH